MDSKNFKSVDEYISQFSEEQQVRLNEIRALIKICLPDAEEGISYGMPVYKKQVSLVYFGGFAKHFSFFPGSSLWKNDFAERLPEYKLSKGTLQIGYKQELPKEVIREIIAYRVTQNEEKLLLKKSKSPKLKN